MRPYDRGHKVILKVEAYKATQVKTMQAVYDPDEESLPVTPQKQVRGSSSGCTGAAAAKKRQRKK